MGGCTLVGNGFTVGGSELLPISTYQPQLFFAKLIIILNDENCQFGTSSAALDYPRQLSNHRDSRYFYPGSQKRSHPAGHRLALLQHKLGWEGLL